MDPFGFLWRRGGGVLFSFGCFVFVGAVEIVGGLFAAGSGKIVASLIVCVRQTCCAVVVAVSVDMDDFVVVFPVFSLVFVSVGEHHGSELDKMLCRAFAFSFDCRDLRIVVVKKHNRLLAGSLCACVMGSEVALA